MSLQIIWMRGRVPTCSGDLFWPHPAVLDKTAIDIRIRAIGQRAPYDCRNRVNHVAQLCFLCSDHRISVTLLGHIGNRSHEFESPGVLPRGVSGHAYVLDGTVGQLQPMLEFKPFAIMRCSLDLILHECAIVGVNSR
jgi:hypothetical protein